MVIMAMVIIMDIIITGVAMAAMEDMAWRWEWDCWDMAWAVISGAERLIMDMGLATGMRLRMDMELATAMHLRMVMHPPLSRCPLRRLYISSSKRSCKSSLRPRHPITGTIAAIRKAIIPTSKIAPEAGCKWRPSPNKEICYGQVWIVCFHKMAMAIEAFTMEQTCGQHGGLHEEVCSRSKNRGLLIT